MKASPGEQQIGGINKTEYILNQITDGIISVDNEWRFTFINDAALVAYPPGRDKTIGKILWDVHPDIVNTVFAAKYREAIHTRTVVEFESYYAPLDIWLSVKVYPSPDGLTIFYRDINVQKRAEQAIKESEEKYKTFFEQATDAIFIFNTAGQFINVNNISVNLLGYTKEEFLHLTLVDIVFAEDLGSNPIQLEILEKEPSLIRQRKLKRKDGSAVEVEINSRKLPEGNYLGVVRDLTERKKAKEALVQSQQVTNLIMSSALDAIVGMDPDGIITIWTPQAEKIFGWKAREVLGKPLGEIIIPVYYREAHRKGLEHYVKTGEGRVLNKLIEIMALNRAGKEFPVELTIAPIRHGDTLFFCAFIRDITKRKKAEDEIRKFNERFEVIASTTYDAIWEWNLITGELWANEVHQKLYGLTKSDPVPDEKEWKQRIHPEDRDKTVGTKEMAFASGLNYWETEYRFKNGEGNYIVVLDRSYIIRNSEGKAVRSTGSMFDITERKKAEETIKHSEEKRRLIMNAALDAIICIDTSGKITFWNRQAEQVFGWKADEVMDCILSEKIIPEQYRKMHVKGIENYLKSGRGLRINQLLELSAIDREGSEFPIELTVLPIKQGGEEFFCAFIRNITNRRKAAEELQQSYMEIRELASHLQDIREEERLKMAREIHDELGQQLTVMKMDVSWLHKKVGKADETVKEKAEALKTMIDTTVKTVRRISSELRPSILDDMGLVPAVEWHLADFKKRSDIKTTFNTSVTELVLADSIKIGLFRIVQESLTNVARYARAKNLTIALCKENNHLLLSVEDDGIGFDHKSAGYKKTLGILGMKERTAMMGGTFEIDSAPGKGTSITVKIPLKE